MIELKGLCKSFEEKEVLAQLVFDLFVSNNNGIGSFEIQALTDGEYQTVYEGVKMGDSRG